VIASIAGPDFLIMLLVVLVLFGATQIPKLARSIGSAKAEFKRGVADVPGLRPEPEVVPQALPVAVRAPVDQPEVPTP
jgi:sec-independent protein translocase protein TatA